MNENSEYPEQLDDEEFEEEKKRLKAEKKKRNKFKEKTEISGISDDEAGVTINTQKNKFKKMIPIILIFVVVVVIAIGIVTYVLSGSVGVFANKQETVIRDYCAYFNSADINKLLTTIDTKGYYIFTTDLKQKDYPKFEEKYANFNENIDDYKEYIAYLNECQKIDSEIYKMIFEQVQMKVESIESVSKIQGTKDLYSVKVKFKISSSNQSVAEETVTETIYVAKIDGEYKIVYGYLTDVLYSLFQSVYSYVQYYGG